MMLISESLIKLFNKTNGGADIIIRYYPQAKVCLGTNKKFSIRDEQEPSVSWYQYRDTRKWAITDWGDDGKPKDAIHVTMNVEGLDWYPAVNKLLFDYGICTTKGEKQQFLIKVPLSQTDKIGEFSFVEVPFNEYDLRFFGPSVKDSDLKDLGWVKVGSTRKVFSDSVITKKSVTEYPIYIRKCPVLQADGTVSYFYKIYEPMNRDKSYRFRYEGQKPPHYINGLYEAKEECIREERQDVSKEKRKPVVIVCGERDAAVAKSFGCKPIWFNSESDFPKDDATMQQLLDLSPVIYFIPDIDTTGYKKGRELALRFPDLRTLWLPEEMKQYRDYRGNPKKDLRDWASLPGNGFLSFRKLLATAMNTDYFDKDEKGKLQINIECLHYYLWLNDIGSFTFKEGTNTRIGLARRKGCALEEITQTSYIQKLLCDQLPNDSTRNAKYSLIMKCKMLSPEQLSAAKDLPYQLSKPSKGCAYIYFQNSVIEITAEGVRAIPASSFDGMVHASDVVKHNYTKPKDMPISFDFSNPDNPQVIIKRYDSYLLRLLINMSRVYWSDEFTNSQLSTLDEYYYQLGSCIESKYLTEEQNKIQFYCLLNKMYAIGYMLSRFKDRREQWAPYFLDLCSASGISNGRSGKGTVFQLIGEMMNMVYFDGRSKTSADYAHAFDRVTPFTRLMRIDDYNPQNIPFDRFYDMISDNMVINPKQRTQFELTFDESPKLVFTSNHMLSATDASTEGRVLYVPVSDWYHKDTAGNQYLYAHTPFDDFGITLGSKADYTEKEWNEDFSVLICCIQFYLYYSARGARYEAPLNLLTGLRQATSYSQKFNEWAMDYFNEDGIIGLPIVRQDMYRDYQDQTQEHCSPQDFGKQLRAWLAVNNFELNVGQNLDSNGRFMKHSSYYNRTMEHFVITRRIAS